MIKLKFVTLAGLMMGLWASGASAETVRCEGNHPANVPAPFTLEFHQQNASDPLNPPWNDSKLTLYHASGDRVVTWRVGPYVRTKRANQLRMHVLGADAAKDSIVYEEKDEMYEPAWFWS